MNQQKPDFSYFSLRLTELLSVSFPDKGNDYKFILLRSQLAESVYENVFKAGHSVSYCTAIAESILFEELTISRYGFIQ